VMLILLVVVGYVITNGIREVTWEFLTTAPRGGLSGEGGISTTIVSTVYLIGLTIVIATPLGIGAAIFLTEYAGETSVGSKFLRSLIDLVHFGVETLAGIPSIIFGLFGFALFVSVLHFGFFVAFCWLSGGLLSVANHYPHHRRISADCSDELSRGKFSFGRHEVADDLPSGFTSSYPWYYHWYHLECRSGY